MAAKKQPAGSSPPDQPKRRSIRERTGVADPKAANSVQPIEVRFSIPNDDGDVDDIDLVVDLDTFNMREDALARQAMARLTPKDKDGKAIGELTISQVILCQSWVVLQRTHDIDFDDLIDMLPRRGLKVTGVAKGPVSPEV